MGTDYVCKGGCAGTDVKSPEGKGKRTMARNSHGFGRLLTAAAVIGAAAAGTWYYLKKKDGSAAAEKPAEDDFDEYEDYDKFEDEELDDIPASSAPEDASETEAAGTNPGRSYVSLDLKKAKEKADDFFSTVSGKVENTVQKIRSSEEYGNVTSKVDEAVARLRHSEELNAVTSKINDAVDRIKNSNEYANVDEQMEHAISRVKEATEKAVSKVGQKINATRGSAGNPSGQPVSPEDDAARTAADPSSEAGPETAAGPEPETVSEAVPEAASADPGPDEADTRN